MSVHPIHGRIHHGSGEDARLRINRNSRIVIIKVVYYGPGFCGKTTNIVGLHEGYAAAQRGELIKLDTETERTLFFDYFPLDLGAVNGHRVKLDLFTVPGQSFYQLTRQAVLENVDGIVFVADSRPDREEANLVSKEDLAQSLAVRGRSLDNIPHVYQWNKRDVRNAIPVRLLERSLNPERAPSIEAVASNRVGIHETHTLLLEQLMARLFKRPAPSAEQANA
ncbi:MAG: gliding-motility protein MglA [Myxococcota bacterium]